MPPPSSSLSQSPNQSTATKRAGKLVFVSRFFNSTAAWIFVILLVVDLLISLIHPLRFINNLKFIPLDKNPTAFKIQEFSAQPQKPDVLILGSSLPLVAIAHSDSRFIDGKGDKDSFELCSYTHAKYLKRLLEQKSGHSLNIFNMTCTGCMVSDADLLLSRAIESGKTPGMVIYGIAPRDFIDNQVPDLGKTPVFQLLPNLHCLADLWQKQMTATEMGEFVLSMTWCFFKVRADYRTLLLSMASDWFNHPPTLFAAAALENQETLPTVLQRTTKKASLMAQAPSNASAQTQGIPTQISLYLYRRSYNPPNYKRFNLELERFRNLLSLCKVHHIELVIVNMPLTKLNRALLPQKLYQQYLATVSTLPVSFGFKYINLDDSKIFRLSDFSDSVHTNAVGGKKVQDRLVSSLGTLN